jgi:hypothetical protein
MHMPQMLVTLCACACLAAQSAADATKFDVGMRSGILVFAACSLQNHRQGGSFCLYDHFTFLLSNSCCRCCCCCCSLQSHFHDGSLYVFQT